MDTFIIALITMGGLGLLLSIGLVLAYNRLKVEDDPRVEKVTELLPNVNCGACGFAGCTACAEALVEGKTEISKCPTASSDAVERISHLLGLDVPAETEKNVALIFCQGGKEECHDKFEYLGIRTCKAASALSDGHKACSYGCLAFGDCALACPFGAIEHTEGNIPRIIPEKCTGCGICVKTCPKNIIRLIPLKAKVHVLCSSHDKGKSVRVACKVGCFACGICVKFCPEKAITLVNNLAQIDYAKCKTAMVCVQKCPAKAIKAVR